MEYLAHHGIRGQRWGKRNGPPYPLSGGDYSETEKREIYRARKKKNSIYNKKHFDQVVSKNTKIATLSYDPNRTKNVDMFYGAHDRFDKHEYNALFNRKISQPIYDEGGNNIGTGNYYKFRITNVANKDIKVASEDSGTDAFLNLYKTNRDFYNFVTDPNRMQSHFVDSKYKFKGYRESRDALEKVRNSDKPTEEDLRKVYRMFNYVIPSDAGGNEKEAKDVAKQRALLFKELKKEGYSAVLDTNDSIYGGFKANSPVIVFDMEAIVYQSSIRVSSSDKAISDLALIGKKALGL